MLLLVLFGWGIFPPTVALSVSTAWCLCPCVRCSRKECSWATGFMHLQLYWMLQDCFSGWFYHHQLFSCSFLEQWLVLFWSHEGAPNQAVIRAEPQPCALCVELCCAPRATAVRPSWKEKTWAPAQLTPTPVVLGWASSWGKALEGAF